MAKVKRSELNADEPETDDLSFLDEEPPKPNDIVRTLQLALTAVSVIAVCLAVAVVVLVVKLTASAAPTTAATTPAVVETAATPAATGSPSAPLFLTKYVEVTAQPKAGAIQLDIHEDYQCPWCARAAQIYGKALGELAQSGDIDLRVHLRTLIGDQFNDASERASRAALCADQVGAFWAYHSVVFANQPAKEGTGFTDAQIRDDFAAQAGLAGDNLATFQTCYDSGAPADAVTAMEQEAVTAGVKSTPSFFVNGHQVSFDLQSNATTVTEFTAENLLSGLQQVAGQF
ncbi:MAG: DsbA family protein [Propionibacteriaceae bacterium]|jgi:protein-disulfide isomerase|nr:DsbA family protein [Propionibacteriaceae bacterium]